MKLSFSTLFCPGYSPEELITLAKNNGIDAVEIRMAEGTWSGTDHEAEWGRVYEKFKQNNITVTDVGSSVTVKGLKSMEEELAPAWAALRFAKAFDGKAIRIFAGNWARAIPEEPLLFDFEKIAEYIRFLCDKAAKDNLSVWLETHNFEFSDGASVKKLADEVGRDNFKIIWDVLHSLEAGETLSETMEQIGDIIAHVHYKDAVPFEEENMFLWKHTILGEGKVDIRKVVELLEEKNYGGYYSLEWEGNGKAELKDLKLSPEAVLDRYIKLF